MKNKTTEEKPKNIWEEIAERAISIVENVPHIEVEINAETASAGLAWNFKLQRPLNKTVVKNFVKIIEDFSFAAGSILRIARDEEEWVLIDGQHRLAAIIESKAKSHFIVVVDSRPARVAYANIDNVGKLRSSGDSIYSELGWKTEKYWTSMVPAAYIISKSFDREVVKQSGARNTTEVIESASLIFRKYESTFRKFTERNRNEAARAPSAAVLIVAAHYQPEKFWPFFEMALADDRLLKNSPEKKLLTVFANKCSDRDDRLRVCIHTILCWNAVYKNQELYSLPKLDPKDRKALENASIPAILGTPYGGTAKQ